MRWLKYGFFVLIFLFAAYAASMLLVDENKNFTVKREINYPIEKVYPQFASLQNFSAWNEFFARNKNLSFSYFIPYVGQGSSMVFKDSQNPSYVGEVLIRYANPLHTLRYQLFEGRNTAPYLIDVKFKKSGPTKTETVWYVHTPKQPLLKRVLNLISHDFVAGTIDKSINNLTAMMSNKVDRETKMALIKYDSLMVETTEAQTLLGISVTTANKKDNLFKNIVMNHNKVKNFIMTDMGKKQDEFGMPVLLTDPNNYKDKEVSFYYGIPVSKKVGISDNNFSFRTLAPSKAYIIYYKGSYAGHAKLVQQLLLKAKKDTMRNGELQQVFLEDPAEGKDCVVKLMLPVYK